MDTATVTLVNQLTLSAAALVACGVLWRAYKGSHEAHLKDLREINGEGIYDLRARMMVLEDHTGVTRAERFDYMKPERAAEAQALDDLDMKKR